MDLIVLGVIAAIVCPAVWYLHRARKKGLHCIGCPEGTGCSGGCSCCTGGCGADSRQA